MPHPDGEAQRLQRVREARLRPAPDLGMAALFGEQRKEFRRLRRSLGGVAEAWERVVPPDLAARTTLQGLSRGTLTVRVPDAPTKFELDRLLRNGAETELIRLGPDGLRRVRILV